MSIAKPFTLPAWAWVVVVLMTPVPGFAQPAITIGTASGTPGSEARIRLSLQSQGRSVALIAPLMVGFDPAVLFPRVPIEFACEALGVGKNTTAILRESGQLSISVAGGADAIADGDFLECTFGIEPGATVGPSTVWLVRAEGADQQLNDFVAQGSDGFVDVRAANEEGRE